MTQLAYTHSGYQSQATDTGAHDSPLWRAVILSLGLHALIVLLYPHFNQISLPELPDKLEIEFFSIKAPPPSPSVAQATPADTPPVPQEIPKPQIAKPIPVQTPKPVLSAPSSESDYRVAEQPKAEQPKAEPLPPVAPSTTPSVTAAPATQTAASDSHATDAQKDTRPATSTQVAVNSESDELTASDSDAWGDYGEQLRNLVNKSKQYPTIAIRRHLEGEVTIVAQFTRGELINVSLADSSKHVSLDDEAMRMVKKAIAQLGVKDSLKKKTFRITIPVSFKLE